MYPIGRSQLTLQAARFIVEKNVGKPPDGLWLGKDSG